VFFGWVAVAFIFQHTEGADQARAGAARFDDLIDIAAGRGRVGIGELGVVFGLFFGGLILQVDAIWGDAAAQPLALAVSVGLPAIAALILSVVYAVSRR